MLGDERLDVDRFAPIEPLQVVHPAAAAIRGSFDSLLFDGSDTGRVSTSLTYGPRLSLPSGIRISPTRRRPRRFAGNLRNCNSRLAETERGRTVRAVFNMGPLETRERARVALNNRMRALLFRVNPRSADRPRIDRLAPIALNQGNRLDPL